MDKIISSKNDYKIEEKDKVIDININSEKWQKKLVAGENIIIDKNNKISASGGEVDPNKYYTKPEVDKKLDDKMDKNQFSSAFSINAVGTENPTLKTSDKTIVGAINEIKANGGTPDLSDYYKKEETNTLLNKKQDKLTLITEDTKFNQLKYITLGTGKFNADVDIPPTKFIKEWINENASEIKKLVEKLVVWKTIGQRVDDRTWSNFSPSLKALYRVYLITETSVPLQNGYKEIIFFTPPSAIGTGTRRITTRKIGNSDANLNIIYDNTKWTLKLEGGDNGGAIYRLEELKAEDLYEIKSNTLEIKSPDVIDIEKPIKIESQTLLTKEIRENEWEINLKENPTPSPCPCPKWKEVGVNQSNRNIHYQFIALKKYRIHYDFLHTENPIRYGYILKEFIYYPLDSAILNLEYYMDVNGNNTWLKINKNGIFFKTESSPTLNGRVWKLEELQE